MRIENLINVLPWHTTRPWPRRNRADIKKIILHQELNDGTIEAVNRYHITPGPNNHISPLGIPHFAYHFGIRKNGEVCQCNEYEDITWHAVSENADSIGIMLVGKFKGTNFPGDEPTREQLVSMAELVDHLQKEFNLNNKTVFGHYHFGKPACPGDTVKTWIQNYRGELMITINTLTDVQQALNALGYACGDADGLLGPKTLSAIRDFQEDNNLKVDGIAGPITRAKLEELLG